MDTLFKFDEKTHSYTYEGKKMTGVTSLLNKTLAKPALIQWSSNEAIKYIKEKSVIDPDIPCYHVTDEILEEARTAHAKIRDSAGDFGKETHKVIEDIVNLAIKDGGGKIESFMEVTGPSTKQVESFLKWAIHNQIKFLASEVVFYSPELFLAGTADLVFEKDGKRYIGDLKVKKKIYNVREPFLQMAFYHMLSESMGNPKGVGSVILRLDPTSGELEEYWSLNVEGDRNAAVSLLEVYRYMSL